MLRVTIAVVLAAVAQFGWGALYWSPHAASKHLIHKAPNEATLAEALTTALPESGTYFMPGCPGMDADEDAKADFARRYGEGPLVTIHYHKAGYPAEYLPAVVFGAGFAHTVVTLALAAFLMSMALPNLETFLRRLLFVFGLGVFATVGTQVADMIWFHHSWLFGLGQVVFGLVSWLLAGVVLGLIIRPQAQAALAVKPHSSLAA